jgi:hypothetical protein
MGKLSTAEVLRLRATSAVSGNKSVGRSAQDDDFVGILTKNILPKLALMGLRPGLSSARPVQIRFFSWPIWTAPEAFTDPKRLGKRLSNEGHGFSRAVKALRG